MRDPLRRQPLRRGQNTAGDAHACHEDEGFLHLLLAAFGAQVSTRVRLIAAAPDTFTRDDAAFRAGRFLREVVGQQKTIAGRPAAGLAHAFVFWGFVAFAGYTLLEFLAGLGIADLTHTSAFLAYRAVLTQNGATVATRNFNVNHPQTNPQGDAPPPTGTVHTLFYVDVPASGEYELTITPSNPVAITLKEASVDARRNVQRPPQ